MRLRDFICRFRKDRLTDDIELGEYFDPFYHSGDRYIAENHCVMKRVCIPGGPQGYREIRIPEEIRTKKELFAYLQQHHGFRMR